MEPLEHGSYTLLESCEECRAKWVESGLVKAMKDVKWHLVRRRQDVADLVYIYIYIFCVIWHSTVYVIFIEALSPTNVCLYRDFHCI